jgi:hypothetical protein
MNRDPLGVIIALLASFLVILLVFWAGGAFAHHVPGTDIVYPPACCNSAATSPTGDCAPIDDKYVKEEPDGYHINLPAGAHPKLKTRGYSEIIPYSDVKRRQPIDMRYHICLADEGAYRYCFFPKPGNV